MQVMQVGIVNDHQLNLVNRIQPICVFNIMSGPSCIIAFCAIDSLGGEISQAIKVNKGELRNT